MIVTRGPQRRKVAGLFCVMVVTSSSIFRSDISSDISSDFLAGALFGVIFLLLGVTFAYQWRTPLLALEDGDLVFWGYTPGEKKRLSITDISKVCFERKPGYFSGNHALRIVLNSRQMTLPIHRTESSHFPEIEKFLRGAFGPRFSVAGA